MAIAYSADALVHHPKPGTWALRPDFDHETHRIKIAVKPTKVTQITDRRGNVLAKGLITGKMTCTITLDTGPRIRLKALELEGRVVGYVTNAPLFTGQVYSILSDPGRTGATSLAELPSLASGTLITTADGDLPIEWLCPGDQIITRDGGALPLRWVGHTRLTAQDLAARATLRPVQITPDSFGQGAPHCPLMLSPQQRIFMFGAELGYYFGQGAVLAEARHLRHLAAEHAENGDFTYFHLLFDSHQVIRANGLWVESLLADPTTHRTARDSGTALPAHIVHDRSAYPGVSGWEARFLQHTRNVQSRLARFRAANGIRAIRAA